MFKIRSYIRTGYLSVATIFVLLFLPITTWADTSSDPCTPPSSSIPGVHWPTGADAGTYTYQCSGTYAGEWTNQYFVFDPVSVTRTPLYDPSYSFDCTSGTWSMTQYVFNAPSGQYYSTRVQTSNPGLPTNCPTIDNGSNGAGSSTDPSISNSGPNSSNNGTTDVNNNLGVNNNTTASMTNNILGVATSGDSSVLGNTTGGSATSGNVLDQENVINMLQSSSNVLGSGKPVMTFTANINGDVNGDILLNPATIASLQATGPNSTNTTSTNLNNNLTVNNSVDGSINNNIDLAANSGDATVSKNTSGGNATSGTAETVANIVNTIDSAITAGQSFIGTININGNLNGNILLPADFVNQLLAANVPTVSITGPSSSNTSSTNVNNNQTVNNTNDLGINNTIDANATSGNAAVSSNTTGGSATSGNAATHITAFNLTGSKVIGANDLLVFVNVTGKWVGLIVNAPAGATAAEFGGGITSSGPNSSNSTNTNVNNNSTLNNNVKERINNNINTDASSGNALVSYNTKGGNATSGNAENAINLMNMENNSLSLSGWFGILFINVFGTWNGNFGTSSGNENNSGAVPTHGVAVFSFVPNGGDKNTSAFGIPRNISSNLLGNGNANSISAALASSNSHRNFLPSDQTNSNSPSRNSFAKTAVTIGTIVVLYILADALITNRKAIKVKVLNKLNK